MLTLTTESIFTNFHHFMRALSKHDTVDFSAVTRGLAYCYCCVKHFDLLYVCIEFIYSHRHCHNYYPVHNYYHVVDA